jgi:HTH-type transcriptional regulator, transcriptional repressor of NAD biosynthesis genes
VWHRRYLGRDDPQLEALIARTRPHLYLVCAPDLPWVQDGTRESRAERDAMHADTVRRVEASGVPWLLLSGPHDTRLATALARIDEVATFPPLT